MGMRTVSPRHLDNLFPGTKTASDADEVDYEKLPDSGFSLIWLQKDAATRLFPSYDKDTTEQSAVLLSETWEQLPEDAVFKTAANLAEAAATYDAVLPKFVIKVAENATERGRVFYSDDYVGSSSMPYNPEPSVFDETNTIKIAGDEYPIRSLPELDAAEKWFNGNNKSLGFSDRYKMACFIQARRDELLEGQKIAKEDLISKEVTKLASMNDFNPQLGFELRRRAGYCSRSGDPEIDIKVASEYLGMAANLEMVKEAGPFAIVEAIEELDKMANLTGLHDSIISDPISAVVVHVKTAEETEADSKDMVISSSRPPVRGINKLTPVNSVVGEYLSEDQTELGSMNNPLTLGDLHEAALSGKLNQVLGKHMTDSLCKYPAQTFAKMPSHVRRLIINQVVNSSR